MSTHRKASAWPEDPQADAMKRIFNGGKTMAVVGLSPKPLRESHGVAHIMQAQGWTIIPVNPCAGAATILGEPVYASLTEAAKAHPHIDVVNVFRNSEDVPPVVQEAIAVGAKAIWLQLGIDSPSLQLARDAGLETVHNKCIKVEYLRQC